MALVHVFFASIGSVIVLFILTKIMGNRQMSQLNMFDYINGITFGSIAAEMATSLETDFLRPLLAMIIYAAMSILVSYITIHSIRGRRLLNGEALILLYEDKLYQQNLKKAKLDVGEFLVQCRINGYFDISDIEAAFLEPNGSISFLPKEDMRPLNPQDLNLAPEQTYPLINIILDGHIMEDNLKHTGNNEKWLEKTLHAQGISKISEVFLATCDHQNKVTVYRKIEKANMKNLFE